MKSPVTALFVMNLVQLVVLGFVYLEITNIKKKGNMNKSLFMQFVAAVITLATTKATDAKALADAQQQAKDAIDKLQAEQDAEKLSDDENDQVQKALNLISAAQPPAAAAVEQVASSVPQS